ncbi:ribosomal protection-like ABC-F family protein [Alkalicoccobacillus gibsonii]|uniref:ribosomal protection-like ABC-F family protein n=1 Tax=Alkalicoccobacillus gibsonii TaxID=79881 RepID=UPI003510D94E
MLYLKIDHLEKSFGGRTIFQIEALSLYDQERVGVVGSNGAGKSTLLSILAGTAKQDSGHVERYGTIAYVPQLEEINHDIRPELYSKWKLAKQTEASGGEQTRRKIAQAISSDAHVLIADEPTSHLDVNGIMQLEAELHSFNGAILLTSHDKDFLNKLCTTIWEIDEGQVTVYEGNYDAYLSQKQLEKEKGNKEHQEYTNERNRLMEAAKKLKAKSDGIKKAPSRMGNSEARLHKRSSGVQKAKLNRSAEAMVTRAQQLEKKEKPKETEPIVFNLADFPKMHSKRVVQFLDCKVKIGERTLIEKVTGDVKRGSRLAILGGNGTGKTTLLKMIADRSERLRVAQPAKIGFFSQHQENLDNQKSILVNVMEDSPYEETFVRKVLARLAFKRDDVFKNVSVLSGGERMRVSMAKVFLSDVNLLILDEPTNYLDLDTKESLTEILLAYPGTILFVSHDRSFVTALATHHLSLGEKEPMVKSIETNDRPASIKQMNEPDILKIDMQLTELLSRLSITTNEEEKSQLDETFKELVEKKKQLVRKAD